MTYVFMDLDQTLLDDSAARKWWKDQGRPELDKEIESGTSNQ